MEMLLEQHGELLKDFKDLFERMVCEDAGERFGIE